MKYATLIFCLFSVTARAELPLPRPVPPTAAPVPVGYATPVAYPTPVPTNTPAPSETDVVTADGSVSLTTCQMMIRTAMAMMQSTNPLIAKMGADLLLEASLICPGR